MNIIDDQRGFALIAEKPERYLPCNDFPGSAVQSPSSHQTKPLLDVERSANTPRVLDLARSSDRGAELWCVGNDSSSSTVQSN